MVKNTPELLDYIADSKKRINKANKPAEKKKN